MNLSTRRMRAVVVRLTSGALALGAVLYCLPAAQAESVLNLRSNGVSSGTINGALYQRSNVQPTGTGVINSFLRVEGANNKPYVQGYNTDARSYKNNGSYLGDNAPGSSKTQFDEKSDLQHTHIVKSVALETLSKFIIGNTSYYGFLLDIGEQGNNGTTPLSMRALQIFQSASSRLDRFARYGNESLGGTLTGANEVYSMDGAGDFRVDLQANMNPPGNGVGDMTVFVPTALFNKNVENVYLYSSFGTTLTQLAGGPFRNGASFQEWATLSGPGGGDGPPPPPVVPLPGAAYAGLALMGSLGVIRRLRRSPVMD